MLKTLLKHEIKTSWLEITIVNGATLVLSIFIALILYLAPSPFFSVLSFSSIILMFGVQIILVVITIVRSLNKKMFSNEGYLTFTLPVTTSQLLISKILINILWIFVTTITIILSLAILGLVTLNSVDFPFYLFYYDITEFVSKNSLPFLLTLISLMISTVLLLILVIFVLALSNTGKHKKRKLFFGVSMFYLFTTLISVLNNVVFIIPYALYWGQTMTIEKITIQNNAGLLTINENGFQIMNFNTLLITLVLIFALFFLSKKIITDKLELE